MKKLSTKTLKLATTILAIIPIVMIVFGPWVLRRPPRSEARAYVRRVALYGGLLAICAVGAGVGAYLILRRQTDEYREQSLENMKALIEATREDQLRKSRAKELDGGRGDDGGAGG